MKFTRVKNTKLNMEYDWLADITSLEDLMKLEESFAGRNARDILDYVDSKDYANKLQETFKNCPRDYSKPMDHCHPRNKIAQYLDCQVPKLNETKLAPILFFAIKMDEIISHKSKELEKTGRILINQNGGYFSWTNDLVELESKECNRFPQYDKRDIKVSKWPSGTHWYITCNGTSVEIDGIIKYKSEKNAWEAADKWIKDNKEKAV